MEQVLIIGSAFVFAIAVVALVLFIVRRVHEKNVAAFEPEGILFRSGRMVISLQLRGYKSPTMFASSMTSRRWGELLLTKRGLVLVMPHVVRISDAPFTGLMAQVNKAGVLHLKCEAPPEAQGSVEAWVRVNGPRDWLAALGKSVETNG